MTTKVDTQCIALVDMVILWGNNQERAARVVAQFGPRLEAVEFVVIKAKFGL